MNTKTEGSEAPAGTPQDQGSQQSSGSSSPTGAEGKAAEGGANPPEGGGGGEGVGAPGTSSPAAKEDWRDRRIGKLAAQRDDLTRRLEEANARLAEKSTEAGKETPAPQGGLTEEEVERRATAKAKDLAARDRFLATCSDIRKDGLKDYKDFDDKAGVLAKLVDPKDARSLQGYTDLIEAAAKTGSGAQAIYLVGSNPEEAERLLGLPPVDQALALSRLLRDGARQETALEAPINRPGGKGPSATDISPSDPARADKLSTAEWMKRREAELADKGKKRA